MPHRLDVDDAGPPSYGFFLRMNDAVSRPNAICILFRIFPTSDIMSSVLTSVTDPIAILINVNFLNRYSEFF